MTNKQKSSPLGVLNEGMTDSQQGTPFINVESPSISVTLASTAPINQTSQPTQRSPREKLLTHVRILVAFANKLGSMAEWRKIELGDGRTGYALFFDDRKWVFDAVSKELTPLG